MKLKRVSVMTAIEDEVRHCRKEFRRIENEKGHEFAEMAWEANKQQLVFKVMPAMLAQDSVTLNEWIELAAALAFDLELLTPKGVGYEV